MKNRGHKKLSYIDHWKKILKIQLQVLLMINKKWTFTSIYKFILLEQSFYKLFSLIKLVVQP